MKTKITTSAFLDIIKTLGSLPAEQGGIGVGKDGVITDFIHDKYADTSGNTYTLNTPYLNPKLKEFAKEGKKLKAIIHTHPRGYSQLSNPDKKYFKSQFKNFEDLEKLVTPIIFSGADGEFNFFPYVFHKDGSISKEELEIVPDNYDEYKLIDNSIANTSKKDIKESQIITKHIFKSKNKINVNITNTSNEEKQSIPISKEVIKDLKVEESNLTTFNNFDFLTFYKVIFACYLLITSGFLIVLIPSFYKYIVQQLLN